MIRMGVIGYGYWGPNILRNFHNQEGVKVVAVCDGNPAALKRVAKIYPDIRGLDRDRVAVVSSQIAAFFNEPGR